MKIVFANPPVIRAAGATPQNDFKIKGLLFNSVYRRNPLLWKIWNKCRDKTARYGVRAGSRWPWTMGFPPGSIHYPFIMGYAAAYIRSYGHDVVLMDAVGEEEYSYNKFLKKIKKEAPDIVVLECSTPTIDIDLWFACKAADFTEVCLAGPHLTTQADRIFSAYPKIQYLLKGEYIISALEMVETRRQGIYESKVVKDLDVIPFPFRDFPAAVNYYDPTMPTPRPQLQIYASKGCPFNCVYCMWPVTMYMKQYSPRKPEKVAEEINHCIKQYGFKSIFFDDDTFNIGNERIAKMCDELAKIGLPWTMMGRLDTSPPELFDKMVDCGCVGMRFGVETFDAHVAQNIKKGLQTDKIVQILNHISQKHPKLMIHLTMMKNLPGQTEEIHKRDMQILKDLGYSSNNNLRNYQLSSCAPFPGTELYNTLVKNDNKKELEKFNAYDGGQETVMKKMQGENH
jgi:anaerobic magnesium-protoporphyrin IX monomethyl ester cyclase